MACPALSQGSLAVARCSNALLFAALLCYGQAPRLNPCESKRRNAELVCVNTLGLKNRGHPQKDSATRHRRAIIH